MTDKVISVSREELFALVLKRREQVHSFLAWASQRELHGDSMYLANRNDIKDAKSAMTLFQPELAWWAVVVLAVSALLESTRAVSRYSLTRQILTRNSSNRSLGRS